MNPTHKISRGFTLLEVMIALVIFSIGLLGLAGLQAVSLQNNQAAYTRTMATMLAYDMGDRIRNNASTDYSDANIPTPADGSCTATGANCNPATLASDDKYQWNQDLVSSGLVKAKGYIIRTTAPAVRYTVSVGWDEGRSGNTPTQCVDAAGAPAPAGTPANTGIDCVSIIVEP